MIRIPHAAVALLGLACAAASALAAELTNPSFEADLYTVWPGYVSGNGGTLTGWTPGGSGNTTNPPARTGINSNPPTWSPANTSPFGNNGAYPDGTQVGFVQAVSAAGNPATTTLSNTITGLTPGESYRLTFRFNSRFNQRPNATVAVGATSVSFQANHVDTAANTFTQPFRTGSLVFTATSPTETLTLSNFAPAPVAPATAVDTTLVVDDFRVAPGTTRWTSSAWTNDADSGVDPTRAYTHAYNLGNAVGAPVAATINGVNFTPVEGGNPAVPGSFTTTGWTTAIGGDDVNDLTAAGGGSADLARRFVYGGAAQTAQTLTLDGLTPGVANRLVLYGVGWTDAANIARGAIFSDGAGDTVILNEHQFGVDKGVKIEFDYVPTGTSQTFTLNPTSSATTFHLYAFTNSVVPEPSAVALVVAGALLLNRRRRP